MDLFFVGLSGRYYCPHPKNEERYCFQFHFTPRLGGGGFTPSLFRTGWVPPSRVKTGGYLHSMSGWGGGISPFHVRMGGGVPNPRSGQGGTPIPGKNVGVLSSQVRMWVASPRLPPFSRIQHSVYLLRRGRYASCVHVGGLSYILLFLLTYRISLTVSVPLQRKEEARKAIERMIDELPEFYELQEEEEEEEESEDEDESDAEPQPGNCSFIIYERNAKLCDTKLHSEFLSVGLGSSVPCTHQALASHWEELP